MTIETELFQSDPPRTVRPHDGFAEIDIARSGDFLVYNWIGPQDGTVRITGNLLRCAKIQDESLHDVIKRCFPWPMVVTGYDRDSDVWFIKKDFTAKLK